MQIELSAINITIILFILFLFIFIFAMYFASVHDIKETRKKIIQESEDNIKKSIASRNLK